MWNHPGLWSIPCLEYHPSRYNRLMAALLAMTCACSWFGISAGSVNGRVHGLHGLARLRKFLRNSTTQENTNTLKQNFRDPGRDNQPKGTSKTVKVTFTKLEMQITNLPRPHPFAFRAADNRRAQTAGVPWRPWKSRRKQWQASGHRLRDATLPVMSSPAAIRGCRHPASSRMMSVIVCSTSCATRRSSGTS